MEPLLASSALPALLTLFSAGDSGTVGKASSGCRFLYRDCLASGDAFGSKAFGVKGVLGLPAMGDAMGDAMGVAKLRSWDPAGDCKDGVMDEIEIADGDAAGMSAGLAIADAGEGRGVTRERDVLDAGEAEGVPSTLEAIVDSFSTSDA